MNIILIILIYFLFNLIIHYNFSNCKKLINYNNLINSNELLKHKIFYKLFCNKINRKKKCRNLKKFFIYRNIKYKIFLNNIRHVNEITESEYYKTRKELKEIQKNKILDFKILKNYIFKKIKSKDLHKFNCFSYIYNEKQITEQIHSLYKIYQKCKKNKKKLPKLFSVLIVLKDNIITKNITTKANTLLLSNYIPSYDSTVVHKLKKNGIIMIAKSQMDQLAIGSETDNVQNFFNLKYLSCGGSSGGSASFLSYRKINLSVNTDTGGSIRIPASLCGCIGLKTTYGLISRYGVIPYNDETDVVGIISNNIFDLSLLLDILIDKDKNDLTSIKKKEIKINNNNIIYKDSYMILRKYSLSNNFINNIPLKNIKFSYLSNKLLKKYFVDNVIKDNYKNIKKHIKILGGKLKKKNIYNLIDYCYIYYMYSMTKANSNISRLNGINYNIFNEKNESNFIANLRGNLMNDIVLSRIIGGSIISQYFDKINIRNIFLKVKENLIENLNETFKTVDYILLPSIPKSDNIKNDFNNSNFKNYENVLEKIKKDYLNISNKKNESLKENHYNYYMKEIFTIIGSITGYPSIVFPTGNFTKTFNEPLSIQIMTKKYNEIGLLKVALAYKEKMNINKKIYDNIKNIKNNIF